MTCALVALTVTIVFGLAAGWARTDAQQASDQQIYEKYRAWVTRQPPAGSADPAAQQAELMKRSRAALAAEGLAPAEIERQVRVIHYQDTDAVGDFGMKNTRVVRLAAEKPMPPAGGPADR